MDTLRPLFILLLLLTLPGCQATADTDTDTDNAATVIVVRHAEKEAGDDPGLTVAGQARAERLRDLLAEVGVTALYGSQYRRTTDTLVPLAELLGLEVGVIPVDGKDPAAQAAECARLAREDHAGGVVAISGHSNTVAGIVAALGGKEMPALADSEYGHIFIVIPSGDTARVLDLSY